MRLVLPNLFSQRQIQNGLPELVRSSTSDTVIIDGSQMRFVTPVGITLLVSIYRILTREGKNVILDGFETNRSMYTYLQRVNFFHVLGVETTEYFARHDATRRFLPLVEVGRGGIEGNDVDQLAHRAGECIVPSSQLDTGETGYVGFVKYGLSELVNNVCQHARGPGVIMAQYYSSYDSVTLSISDTGIGIRESLHMVRFSDDGGPTHSDSISKALEPRVTSKGGLAGWGEGVNAGVGLTLVAAAAKVSGGECCIVSGSGYFYSDGSSKRMVELDCVFKGTMVAFRFQRSALTNFVDILEDAKKDVGLGDNPGKLDSMFK